VSTREHFFGVDLDAVWFLTPQNSVMVQGKAAGFEIVKV